MTEVGKESYNRCKACAEEIRVEAQKCFECGEYQNSLRFLRVGPTIIAMLTALISSASALYLLHNQYRPFHPRPLLSYLRIDETGINVGIVNQGLSPAYIDFMTLSARGKAAVVKTTINIMIEPKHDDNVIQPNSNRNFIFTPKQFLYAVPTPNYPGSGKPTNDEISQMSEKLDDLICSLNITFHPYADKITDSSLHQRIRCEQLLATIFWSNIIEPSAK